MIETSVAKAESLLGTRTILNESAYIPWYSVKTHTFLTPAETTVLGRADLSPVFRR